MAEQTIQGKQTAVATAEKRTPTTREETRYQIPPVDIFEDKEGLTVVVDMPGVENHDASVRVNDGILTIQGTVKPRAKGESIYNEYLLLDYFRQFELSDVVDQDKISAELKHGVLTIRLPKMQKAKPKEIAVHIV